MCPRGPCSMAAASWPALSAPPETRPFLSPKTTSRCRNVPGERLSMQMSDDIRNKEDGCATCIGSVPLPAPLCAHPSCLPPPPAPQHRSGYANDSSIPRASAYRASVSLCIHRLLFFVPVPVRSRYIYYILNFLRCSSSLCKKIKIHISYLPYSILYGIFPRYG